MEMPGKRHAMACRKIDGPDWRVAGEGKPIGAMLECTSIALIQRLAL